MSGYFADASGTVLADGVMISADGCDIKLAGLAAALTAADFVL